MTGNGDRIAPGITLPRGADPSKLLVGTDGSVSLNGSRLGKISVVDVQRPGALQSVGDNLFLATPQSGAPAAARASQVKQGQVEGSNVDMSNAMVQMIQAQRGYGFQSKVIEMQDQLMQIANGLRQ